MKEKEKFVMLENPRLEILPALFTPPEKFGSFSEVIKEEDKQKNPLLKDIIITDMHMPDFSIRTFKGSFTENVVIVNEKHQGSRHTSHCFFFKGAIKTFMCDQSRSVELGAGYHNFKFDPHHEFFHLMSAHQHINFLHFSVAQHYLLHMLPEGEPWAEALKERILNEERILPDNPGKITLAQEIALDNILNCNYQGKLGKLMVESSMLHILIIQLNALFQTQSMPCQTKASNRDKEIIYGVKEFLDNHYLDTHSLACLSKHFGVNQHKLTTTFRSLFGTSVFDYILDLKMNHAKALIQDHNMLIAEVSELLGYKNQQHFTVAFKKKFGVIPSKMKTSLALSNR